MSARISPIKINPRDSRRNRAGLNWLLSLRSGLERYEIGFEARMDGNPRNMDDDEAGGKSVLLARLFLPSVELYKGR